MDEIDYRPRGLLLTGLVNAELPMRSANPESVEESWRNLVAPALLAKAAGTLTSIMELWPSRRDVDALALTRVLFENIVWFSWVAVDPSERVMRWKSHCCHWEVNEYNEVAEVAGPDGCGPREETLKEAQAHLAEYPYSRISVPRAAVEADEHWSALVHGWRIEPEAWGRGSSCSLRGLCRFIYSIGSHAVHSRHRALDPAFTTYTESEVEVHVEEPCSEPIPYDLALIVMTLGIGAAFCSLGWPSYETAYREVGSIYLRPET